MRTHLDLGVVVATMAALLVTMTSSAVVSAIFLDEPALAELAEREGYALTLHAVERARRAVNDASEQCRCSPPGPPPPFPDDMPPPPPAPESTEEGGRTRPPMPPRGCWPPPPPGSWSPRHHHHHHRVVAEGDDNGPPCELRPLFRVPDKFNFTARVTCFDRWERESAKQMGMAPEDRFDPAKYKPTQHKPLMWNKGCDMQCHFMELELLTGDGDELSVDVEALAGLLKEEGDSSDITAAVDEAIKTCVQLGADMMHAKQVCQSGADEILFCLQRSLEETCPGSKWQGQRSCDEIADVSSKLRSCWHSRRMMHPHPYPPSFEGRRRSPSYMRPARPGVWPPPYPAAPVQPNAVEEVAPSKSDA